MDTSVKLGHHDSNKARKRLPEIPPEELALHGGKETADGQIKPQGLPPEVQANIRRRQFKSSIHKRSRSLSGLEGIDFYLDVDPKQTPNQEEVKESNSSIRNDKENIAMSLPNTPVIQRRSSTGNQLSKEDKDQEILKELRWHYKQYIRASKRKKEKISPSGEPRVVGAVQAVLSETADKKQSFESNRCDSCGKSVDILERVAVENHVFHKACFVCAICNVWLNHFNYCFVPDHDKFYCVQHYQDIENATEGLGSGEIRKAMGIGPGVQQQFKFTPDVKSGGKEDKTANRVQNSLKIMKEKIALLSKRGKKLTKRSAKLKTEFLKCNNDEEKRKKFFEWFDAEHEKNTTVRREAELTFKVRETELSEKYHELEKQLRVISEKSENTKTEYDKSKEKELLQEMLVVVEKREQLIAEMDESKHRYMDEDKDLERQSEEIGVNRPDLIKDATAADKDAHKVSSAVSRAPSTVKKQSLMCPGCTLF
ncbi:F-actin-monooxygenase MICAL1 [Nematostella vectensis]|uniref:F-actin-monooxygenase MICAL1 n=1 Tax=Nematostella vectensis TaxID=45351 RepID=UPI0013902ED7|nr:F-actin-monooxygenase MICAL1 [Nematostella vectensis]XP_032221391.1 F-actin-monooxygenase MICAL1 [Nematostella vectensis]